MSVMVSQKLIGYVFFFILLAGAFYLVWELIAPFAGSLALAAIISTICYPLYEYVLARTPKKSRGFASLLSVFLVIIIVVTPLILLGSVVLKEAHSVYQLFSADAHFSLENTLSEAERLIQTIIPGFTLDVGSYIRQVAGFFASHIGSIFAGTASTIFYFFIALIALFYFFRDGKEFTSYLIKISPLPNVEDEKIIRRLAAAIRGVALGTILVALIQGILTAVGLSLFGFDRAVLFGCIAAIGALIPGVGTAIIFVPATIYLAVSGSYVSAVGVAIWGVLAVGFIDNLLGPYLMSRGNNMHPFLILIAVLGGIAFFGPVGFILGPVMMTFFMVLLEMYASHTGELKGEK